jgi:hypothetical protein
MNSCIFGKILSTEVVPSTYTGQHSTEKRMHNLAGSEPSIPVFDLFKTCVRRPHRYCERRNTHVTFTIGFALLASCHR